MWVHLASHFFVRLVQFLLRVGRPMRSFDGQKWVCLGAGKSILAGLRDSNNGNWVKESEWILLLISSVILSTGPDPVLSRGVPGSLDDRSRTITHPSPRVG